MIPQEAGFPEPARNTPPERRNAKPVAGRIDPARRGLAGDPHAGMVPAGLSSSPDMSSYLQALRRRWVVAASLGGTLAILAALAAWFLMSPKYIAFAKVRVAFEQPSFGNQAGGHGDFLTYLKTQANLIMSRPVVSSALKRDEIKRLNLEALTGKDPAQFIEDELKVEFQDNQELLTITLGANDPQVSQAIVKAVVDSYMDDFVYAEQRAREGQVADLDKALSQANDRLKRKQESLASLNKNNNSTDSQQILFQLNEMQARIVGATNQQSNIRLDLEKAKADLASHKTRIAAIKDMAVSPAAVEAALKADPKAAALEKSIEKAQDVIDDFERLTRGPAWPSHTAARNRIKKAQRDFAKRKKEVQEELARASDSFGAGSREELEFARVAKENAITALVERDKQLDKEITAASEQMGKLKLANRTDDILREQIENDTKFVGELSRRHQEKLLDINAAPRVTKIQDAELQKKDMKKQIMATAVSPVMALMAVCMLVAWLDVRQRRIRSAGEVARGLGIRVVGAVPSVPDLERHLIGPNGEPELEGHPALESIDALRTMLLRDADDEATRLVMVTSATHGEGKTTVASHLAGSLARAGRKTLLIDGDLRRPSAHQLFELPMQPGFSEVLLAEVELTDAVQPTTLDGLSFMAAGQWDREVLQALARDGVEGIFEKLQQEFDFIVIDSHPVLPATDSLLIGQRVDAVILSVLREVSQMPRVYAASQRLTTLGIRVLGAVVNGADPEEALAATASARMVAH
ncbi:MAG TPA: polysaccharide biosynthesis tyrosine autokinase [Gemmataceae bacterium]